MSEERSQTPTKRRRQEARQRGHVARSAELTAGAGLLIAAVLLGVWGDGLTTGLIELIRAPLAAESPVVGTSVGPVEVAAWIRGAAGLILAPIAGILAGVAAVMIVAHQVQVGGLFAPELLAPELSRLWNVGGTGSSTGRLGRACWTVVKAVGVIVVAGWFLRGDLTRWLRLGSLEPVELASAAARLVLDAARAFAVVILGLGAIDYLLCWKRIEAQLSLTPDEYREELKATDGDPALRARRRKQALSWRQDAAEVLPGATLCLYARGGAVILLGGGPPPGAITVRHIAQGMAGTLLRQQAERAGVPCLESPRLARHFARGRAAGSSLPPALAAELRDSWPRANDKV